EEIFWSKKGKVIQEDVSKLFIAGHMKEIKFPEWLSNVVLVPNSGNKWCMCVDFRDVHEACPEDFYPLLRIDLLVDSTSVHELLSQVDA
ncbi:UNVERIFIED_CONTAM: hypothetical protein Slati_2930800, partial [Sesamum latifolium]